MNGLIIFSNKECPTGTKKLSENVFFMEDTIDDTLFRKSEDPNFVDNKNTGMEGRIMTLCQYPLITDQKNIPQGSYFTSRTDKCPSGSSRIGKIATLDLIGQNNENYKYGSYVSEKGNPYYDYVWNIPTLCKADQPIDIDKDIILPSDNCQGDKWTNVGTYGMLGSVFDYSFYEDTNNINIDVHRQFFPNQYIILPRMCAGYGNEIIKRCANADNSVYKNKCDEEMREICKTIEYGDDNICSCLNSKIKLIGNPLYLDTNCIQNGYKTYEMKHNMKNFFQKTGLIECDDLNRFLEKHPGFRLERNRYTNHCFNTKPVEKQETPTVLETIKSNYWIYILIGVGVILLIIFLFFFIRSKLKTRSSSRR